MKDPNTWARSNRSPKHFAYTLASINCSLMGSSMVWAYLAQRRLISWPPTHRVTRSRGCRGPSDVVYNFCMLPYQEACTGIKHKSPDACRRAILSSLCVGLSSCLWYTNAVVLHRREYINALLNETCVSLGRGSLDVQPGPVIHDRLLEYGVS